VLLESLIAMMIGASLFGLGVALGAVIEFKRVKAHFDEIVVERDEAYHENMALMLQMQVELGDRVKLLQNYAKYSLDELRKVEESVYSISPEITQELPIIDESDKRETDTPMLRWHNDYDKIL